MYGLDRLHGQVAGAIVSAIIIAIAVLAAGMAATVLIVRQFLKPIGNLVQTVKAIEEGDLTQRASPVAVYEIGILARAFNRMADFLSHYTQDLEEQVAYAPPIYRPARARRVDWLWPRKPPAGPRASLWPT